MEELFAYIFGIYIKFGYKNPSILTPCDSVDIATIGWVTSENLANLFFDNT